MKNTITVANKAKKLRKAAAIISENDNICFCVTYPTVNGAAIRNINIIRDWKSNPPNLSIMKLKKKNPAMVIRLVPITNFAADDKSVTG